MAIGKLILRNHLASCVILLFWFEFWVILFIGGVEFRAIGRASYRRNACVPPGVDISP